MSKQANKVCHLEARATFVTVISDTFTTRRETKKQGTRLTRVGSSVTFSIFAVAHQSLCEQLCGLLLWRLMIEVEADLVGHNEREIRGRHGEYVAEEPSFKKIKCDVGVKLKEGLERDQPLLKLLVCHVSPSD
jgi:hypothetical protein